MQSSTAAFEAALAELNHQYVSRIELWLSGDIVDDTHYQQKYFRLMDGQVENARQSDTRTNATGTFEVLDSSGMDLMNPISGVELHIYCGLMIDGVPEWIKQGVLGLNGRTVTRRSTGLQVDWSATDRSDRIRWLPFNAPFSIASGTDYFVATKNLITNRAVNFTPEFNFGSSALATPDIIFAEDDDPWADALKLAEAVGCELYYDEYGVLNMLPVPDPLVTVASKQFVYGQPSPLLAPIANESSNRDVYNGVICKGEAPWLLFPIRGEAWDTDPLSQTYRYGPFGEKAKRIGDALATTDAQCATAAAAELRKVKGVVENINFDMVSDPRQQVGDIIDYYDADFGLKGRLMLDTRRISFRTGVMSGTIRRQV